MREIRITLLAMTCMVLLLGAGCTFIENEGRIGMVKGVENASLDATYDATLKALEALELEVRRSDKDAMMGQIEGRTADRKRLTIDLERLAENSTKVSIHIDPMGDKTRSNVILAEIENQLHQ